MSLLKKVFEIGNIDEQYNQLKFFGLKIKYKKKDYEIDCLRADINNLLAEINQLKQQIYKIHQSKI